MSFYTYILKSELNGRYYIGCCSDVAVRLIRHNQGATPSTKPYRPWSIVWTEKFDSKSEAIIREQMIKRMKSRAYIESLIREGGSAG
jgi:putative endonuclease